VKAFVNDGEARYYGVDTLVSYRFSTRWSAEGNYSYLAGHDLHPKRPVRRLPPQQGFVSIRYQPGGRISWVGVSAYIAGRQEELSGGDLTDERIGAARRRSDIADFFRGGLIRPYLIPGIDGQFGTADDVFTPTEETLAQIRDRVLPIGATINGVTIVDDGTRVPLYTHTPAFVSMSLGAGASMAKNLSLKMSVSNLLDRSYRVHGSGVDAPGISVYASVHVSY
jgi:outer membrane receptor protein involved in Fe transport